MRPARASNGSSRRRRRARSWPASIQTPPKSRNHCDGVLVRKLLRRASFTFKDHVQQRIEAFIAYFNATMAKPFRWTLKGKPLAAGETQQRWKFRRGVLGGGGMDRVRATGLERPRCLTTTFIRRLPHPTLRECSKAGAPVCRRRDSCFPARRAVYFLQGTPPYPRACSDCRKTTSGRRTSSCRHFAFTLQRI